MNRDDFIKDGWPEVASRLSGGRDLEEWGRACGAFERPRGIKDATTLLRVGLAYGGCGLSLRQAAAWADAEGLARLTDEALLGRLGKAGAWFAEIASGLMAGRLDWRGSPSGRRVRILDGTTVTAPGADKLTWRLQITFAPDAQQISGIELTPATEGETMVAAALTAGDLLLADRGYARPEGLRHVLDQKADFLVRLGCRSLRLLTPARQPFDLKTARAIATATGCADLQVLVGNGRQKNWQPVPARLVVIPKPAEAAASSRQKTCRAAQQEGYTPSQEALESADFLILLTSLSPTDASVPDLVTLYRMRWQVELVIKRLKSLGHLDRLPAKSAPLAKAWLCANLICSLLIEDLMAKVLDSPPSGPHSHAPAGLNLAPLVPVLPAPDRNHSRTTQTRHPHPEDLEPAPLHH